MTTPLNNREESREADALQREVEQGDSEGLKEHINRLYSEHGLGELRSVLARLKENEEQRGVSVNVTEHGRGLPDITITGTDNRTDENINYRFDSNGDAAGAASIRRDGSNHITEFTTPDGERFQMGYAANGTLNRVSTPDGTAFERGENGNWASPARDVTVDQNTGEVRITLADNTEISSRPDGSFSRRGSNGNLENEVDSEGTNIEYTYDAADQMTGTRTTANDSPLTDVRNVAGERSGYEFTQGGHTETLSRTDDGGFTLNRGSRSEVFPPGSRVDVEPDGDRRITRPDRSSFEGRADGTTISRDAGNHITEMTRSDGNSVTFNRDERGNLNGMEVRDGTGRVVESATRDGNGWQGTARDAAGNQVAIRDVRVNDRDGTVSIGLEGNARVEQRIDGTEEHLRNNRHVDSRTDQYVQRMRDANVPMSETEETRLRADLARIDGMDTATRERVYRSLDRMATANTDSTTHLTPEQRSELVRSTAHNIAHPEDIVQGGKNSCTMANAEMLMATNHPDRYADMVTSLAVDGNYTAPNGRTLEPTRDADGSLAANSDGYGVRSLSSELFQSAAMDVVLPAGQDYRSLPPGSPDREPRPPDVNASTDSGERVYANPPPAGTSRVENGQTIIREDRGDGDYYDWLMLPDGRAVRGFTGTGMDNKEAMMDALAPEDNYGRRAITSNEALLSAYDANGGPPLNVGVSLGSDVDVTGMSEGSAGTDAGNHAITITHIDRTQTPPLVYFENSANGTDHSYPRGQGVPLNTFADAMRTSNREALVRSPRVSVLDRGVDYNPPGSPIGPPSDGTALV